MVYSISVCVDLYIYIYRERERERERERDVRLSHLPKMYINLVQQTKKEYSDAVGCAF
jgi:hypothetical protein